MNIIYRTETLTEELRDKFNGRIVNLYFSTCEHCKAYHKKIDRGIAIRYYWRYRKALCDRCVDNFDGITPWSDRLSFERGLPAFPIRQILDYSK